VYGSSKKDEEVLETESCDEDEIGEEEKLETEEEDAVESGEDEELSRDDEEESKDVFSAEEVSEEESESDEEDEEKGLTQPKRDKVVRTVRRKDLPFFIKYAHLLYQKRGRKQLFGILFNSSSKKIKETCF
jgi:hypothetical protein